MSYEGPGEARSFGSPGHVGETGGPFCPGMGFGAEEIPTFFGRVATISSCSQVSGGLRRWDSLLCDKDSNINGSPQYLLQALAASVLAMASGSGRYALEAAAGPLDSASNLDQVQQARVREFREANRLLDDADFAFSFSTYEEAKLKGGDFLAAAWAKVRAQEEEKLVPAAAAALDKSPAPRSFFRAPSSKADALCQSAPLCACVLVMIKLNRS